MLLFNAILTPFLVRLPYFNTSNVTIQHFSIEIKLISIFISIHLMLLFNINLVSLFFTILIISIHLMLLFNCFSNASSNADIIISIHLMLLFNFHIRFLSWHSLYFNTSNVTIQLQKPLQRLWKSLDFNTSNVTIRLKRNVKLQ